LINVSKLSYLRVIQNKICTDEEVIDDDQIIEYTASNPIRQYKLIDQMLEFARHIYPEFLYLFLDTGTIK
jgi:hypothetical protein